MKRLKYLAFALLAILTCAGFASCGDDDNNDDGPSQLSGTSWKVISSDDKEVPVGLSISFLENGSVKFFPQEWTYGRWHESQDALGITVGQGVPDDYMIGDFTIKDNRLTWSYYWADVDGKWEKPNEPHLLILEKQSKTDVTDPTTPDHEYEGSFK